MCMWHVYVHVTATPLHEQGESSADVVADAGLELDAGRQMHEMLLVGAIWCQKISQVRPP